MLQQQRMVRLQFGALHQLADVQLPSRRLRIISIAVAAARAAATPSLAAGATRSPAVATRAVLRLVQLFDGLHRWRCNKNWQHISL